MAKRAYFGIALLLCVLFSRDVFAAGPFGTIHVGNWGAALTQTILQAPFPIALLVPVLPTA
jgi:hypothetical protein